jgi:nitric oxide reductase NorQ protein
VAPEVVFFATLNEGEEFIGTEMLDAALRDRFYTMVLDYLPAEVETKVLELKGGISNADALTIVNIANQLRGNAQEPIVVSTRHTLMIAELVAIGATVNEAFVSSLQVSKDVLESILLSLHIRLGLKERENGHCYRVY